MSTKQFSEACERNKEPILAVLRTVLADRKRVLEIGSGTGQHAVYFAMHLPHLIWQPSDLRSSHESIDAWQKEYKLPNILPPIELDVKSKWPLQSFDAVFAANTCHIMAWSEVQAMFQGIGAILQTKGMACIYGPFNYDGQYTSPSNECFDSYLKAMAPHMGIRNQEEVNQLAKEQGLVLIQDHAMPSNNRLIIWQKP